MKHVFLTIWWNFRVNISDWPRYAEKHLWNFTFAYGKLLRSLVLFNTLVDSRLSQTRERTKLRCFLFDVLSLAQDTVWTLYCNYVQSYCFLVTWSGLMHVPSAASELKHVIRFLFCSNHKGAPHACHKWEHSLVGDFAFVKMFFLVSVTSPTP